MKFEPLENYQIVIRISYLLDFLFFSEIFVANVFASNSEEEEKLCCNQLVSRVFEKLLPLAPTEVKTRIMTKLGSDLRLYVTNPFASHILETLLTLASFKQKTEQVSYLFGVSKF